MRLAKTAAWLAGIGFALMCLACGTGTTTTVDSSGGTTDATPAVPQKEVRGDGSMAYVMAQKYVTKFLNFPHNSKFPWGADSKGYDSDLGAWQVQGKMTARNAFGADLTYEWTTIVYTEDGAAWNCHVVIIDDELMFVSDAYKIKRAALVAEAEQKTEEARQKRLAEEKAQAKADAEAATEARIASRHRTWTAASGEFTIEASLVSRSPDVVRLRKDDGTSLEVPIEKLSDADREYLKSLVP